MNKQGLLCISVIIAMSVFCVSQSLAEEVTCSFTAYRENLDVVFGSPYPSDESWVLPTDHYLNITVTNSNDSSMDISFFWGSNDTLIGTDTGVANNTVASVTVGFDYARYQEYTWYATVWSNTSSTYGFTGEAYDWDINRDAEVNYLDASSLTGHYGEDPYSGREDINGDNEVDYLDASSLTGHYGESY